MFAAGVTAVLALLAAVPALAQTPGETAVRAAESALAEAMAARDADGLRRIVAENFATTDDTPLARAAWVETLLPLCGGTRVSTADMQVVVREDSALVAYVATVHRDHPCEPSVSRLRIAHVWSLIDDAWRLALRNAQPFDDHPPATVRAPEPAPPAEPRAPKEWAGSLEVTVLSTRGNVNTFTFGSASELAWQRGPWRTDFRGAFLRTTTDAVEDRYSVNIQLRQSRRVSGVVELFGRALYQRDLFAGILRRYGVDAGFGFVIVRDGHRLQATAGAGSTEEARLNAPMQSSAIATTGLQYRFNMNGTTAITEDFMLTSSLKTAGNWRIESTLAFTTVFREPLQLRTSYQAKYSNQPVPGFKPFDGTLAVALTVRF